MTECRNHAAGWAVLLVLVLGGLIPATIAAEGIQFSKPEVSIATPPAQSPEVSVPGGFNNDKGYDFRSRPELGPVFVPPPIRETLRKPERKRSILDDPEIFSDRSKEAESEDDSMEERGARPNPLLQRQSIFQPRTMETDRNRDEKRALTPVDQFDWRPESELRRGLGMLEGGVGFFSESGQRDQKKLEGRDGAWSAIGQVERPGKESESWERLGNVSPAFLNFNSNREWSRDQLERRSNFERMIGGGTFTTLLNPGQPNGNSLTPVTSSLEGMVGPVAPVGPGQMGIVAAPEVTTPARPFQSMQSFDQQQQKTWKSTTFDDLNQRLNRTEGSSMSPVSAESAPKQRPLMKQPAMLDFPTRRF